MAKVPKAKPKKELITKGTTFSELLEAHPESVGILLKYNLHCIGCHGASFETIEQGCRAHGMSKEQINILLRELNKEK